jgi:hypothetical protein
MECEMFGAKTISALLVLTYASETSAQVASTNIQVASCVGQINLVSNSTIQGSLVFSITDQALKHGAEVIVTENTNPAAILSAGGGNMALTVPSNWREPIIAMAFNGGYQIVANLTYHMNGSAYVLDDFRITRSLAGHTECP